MKYKWIPSSGCDAKGFKINKHLQVPPLHVGPNYRRTNTKTIATTNYQLQPTWGTLLNIVGTCGYPCALFFLTTSWHFSMTSWVKYAGNQPPFPQKTRYFLKNIPFCQKRRYTVFADSDLLKIYIKSYMSTKHFEVNKYGIYLSMFYFTEIILKLITLFHFMVFDPIEKTPCNSDSGCITM